MPIKKLTYELYHPAISSFILTLKTGLSSKMKTDIEIEIHTVEKLREMLSRKEFWFQNVAPITKHRAQLIINNPRSNSDDPVLFIAKNSDKIVGYRLVFPDRIYVDNEAFKLGWGSCFWVDKSYRGTGIGKMLFQKSLELWNGNIGSLIQSRDAARVYEGSSEFYCFRQSVGYQFILKLNFVYWMQKKIRIFQPIRFFLGLIDLPVNGVLSLLQHKWNAQTQPLKQNHLEYYREITDEDTIQFVNERNRKAFLRRGVAEFNTIVKFPTSISAPLPDAVKSRYFFATKAKRFDYYYFKSYDKNMDLAGLALINQEGQELRLLYYFSKDESNHDTLFNIVLLHAKALNVEIITSYDDRFNRFIKSSGFPTLFDRRQVRKSFLPVRFQPLVQDEFLIFDGDGA